MLSVKVVYCPPDTVWAREVRLEEGATLRSAILASGVIGAFPDLRIEALDVGVFSRRREMDEVLKDGDRVEIYRPLLVEPKEGRRRRAELRRRKPSAGD